MATDKISLYDIVLAPLFVAGACYFVWDCIRDMRRGENRPRVTDDLVNMAFEEMLKKRSDAEMEDMDWLDDDDDETVFTSNSKFMRDVKAALTSK